MKAVEQQCIQINIVIPNIECSFILHLSILLERELWMDYTDADVYFMMKCYSRHYILIKY